MKILLTTLNAKYVHSNLALKYLYAVAEAKRRPVQLREFTINNDDDYIFCELARGGYELICFSCYVWNIRRTLTLARNVKLACPGTRILLGGPEVSFDGEALLAANPFLDYVILGEGEETFSLFLDRFSGQPGGRESGGAGEPEENQVFADVPGLVWRENNEIQVNERKAMTRFEDVPFPYDTLSCEEDKVAYYESVRGCPFRCAYCLSSVDKSIRALPMERIKTDLSYFIYKKVKQVKFIDRTFNYNPARCAEMMRYLMDNDNGVTNFHLEVCGDLMDEAMLRLLEEARPGLFQLEIGVQSTNEATLQSIGRRCDFQRLSQNVRRLRKAGGVHLHLDLIAGLPYEDFESFQNSFNQVYSLRPHDLQLGFLKLLKGSPLRAEADQYGYVYREEAPYEVISSAFLSAQELVRLKLVESVLDLYHNRGGFEETVERAAFVLWDTPFAFYEELAQYYYLAGFQHKSHKKEDQYRILYAFFRWRGRRARREETFIFELLERDLRRTMNPEAVKKFMKKGWELD